MNIQAEIKQLWGELLIYTNIMAFRKFVDFTWISFVHFPSDYLIFEY